MENPLSFLVDPDVQHEWPPSETEIAIQHLVNLCNEIDIEGGNVHKTADRIRAALSPGNYKDEKQQSIVLAALARTIPYITEDQKLVEWFMTECRMLLEDHATAMNRQQFYTRTLAYYCTSHKCYREQDQNQILKILASCPIDKHPELIRVAVAVGNHEVIRLLLQSGCKRWDMFTAGSLRRLHNTMFASRPIHMSMGQTTPGQAMAWILALGEKQLVAEYGPPLATIPSVLAEMIDTWSHEPRVSLCLQNARDAKDNDDPINALRSHIQESSCDLCKNDASMRLFPNFPGLFQPEDDLLISSSPCWDYIKALCVVVFQRDENLFRTMCRMLSHGWKRHDCEYDAGSSYSCDLRGFELVLPLVVAACMGDFTVVRFVLFYLPEITKLDLSRTAHVVGSYAAFCGQMTMAYAIACFGAYNHSIPTAAAYYGDYKGAFRMCEHVSAMQEAGDFWILESDRQQCITHWYILRAAAFKGDIDILQQHLPALLSHRAGNQGAEYEFECIPVWKVKHLLAAAVQGDSIESAHYLIKHMNKFGSKQFCNSILAEGPSLEIVHELLPENYTSQQLLHGSFTALLVASQRSPSKSFKAPIQLAFDMMEDIDEQQRMAHHYLNECMDLTHIDHQCETCNLADILEIFLHILKGLDTIKRSHIRTLLRNKHCARVMRIMTKTIKSHEFLGALFNDQPQQMLTGSSLALYGTGLPFAPHHQDPDLFTDRHLCIMYSYGRRQPEQWGEKLWSRVQSLAQACDDIQSTIKSDDVMNLIHSYLS